MVAVAPAPAPERSTNTHILFSRFDYYRPTTLDAVLSLLAQLGPDARLLAGGTDLLVQMKMERAAPRALIDIGGIPGLGEVAGREGRLHIGATCPVRALERSATMQERYTALAEACAAFSSTQVATMATLGGNLANASPAADTAPALIALGATIEVTGSDGTRSLPLEQFFLGPGRAAMRPGEIVTAVALPPPEPGSGSAFAKITRVANDMAKASCAAVIVRDGDRVAACRLAFGAVAPVPLRATGTEAALAGQEWNEEHVQMAARLAAQEVSPIDDLRSTAVYRREVVRVLAGDVLRRAWQRACQPAGKPASSGSGNVWLGQPAGAPARPIPSHAGARDRLQVTLRVNGQARQVWAAPNDLLLNVLRHDLELTGTKYGCGIGECSACTVLLDGQPVLACLVLALAAAGREITTIEGLANADGTLHPLQEAFIDHAAYQCGYCTPGMLLTARSLLDEVPHPEEADVRHHLRGNMCRCTGYASIVRAVLAAVPHDVDG